MTARDLARALAFLALPSMAAAGPLAEYRSDSGSLPPEYAWDVRVTVDSDGRLELIHCTGYATEGPGCRTRRARVDAADLAALLEAARASGLAGRPAGRLVDVPVGGGATSGAVWLDGQKIALPAFPAEADAARVSAVLAAIRATIPPRLVRRFLEGN